jgi:hypothetical protein
MDHVLVRDKEFDRFRHRDRFRELQLGAGLGIIADQAIDARSPVIVEDASLKEASRACGYAAFVRHGDFPCVYGHDHNALAARPFGH